MKLDRALQKHLLHKLANSYPARCAGLYSDDDETADNELANLLYLEEHGLVVSGMTRSPSGKLVYTGGAMITAKGLDLIANDGGIAAILDTCTLRLDGNAIRAMIEAKIETADLPRAEKERLIELLGKLSRTAMGTLTVQLIEAGLDQLQAVKPAEMGERLGELLAAAR